MSKVTRRQYRALELLMMASGGGAGAPAMFYHDIFESLRELGLVVLVLTQRGDEYVIAHAGVEALLEERPER